MEMKTFRIDVRASVDSSLVIEAKDESEARDKAEDMTMDELLQDGNYIEVDPVVTRCECDEG